MIEQLKIYGQDVFYIPRTLVKEDELFGEDTLSKFGDAYLIEMYFENVEGYEGDLVYFPKVNKIFEISFVDHDDPFYQVHNVPAFKLKCKTFEYGGEDIDTGITEIDAIETANSLDMLTFQITMEQSSTTTFNEGIELEDGTGNLELETQTGGTDNVIGEDETGGDNVVLETGDYIIQEAYVTDTIDENAMNDFFDRQDDNIIDFTESNPFGDVGKVG